jgi:hypothetical protein
MAFAAFYALILIHVNPEKTYPVKERIDCAQRAGGAAKRPFAYYHPCKEKKQDGNLYDKYRSDKLPQISIVQNLRYACFQRPYRAKLGKPWLLGDKRNNKYQEDEGHISPGI